MFSINLWTRSNPPQPIERPRSVNRIGIRNRLVTLLALFLVPSFLLAASWSIRTVEQKAVGDLKNGKYTLTWFVEVEGISQDLYDTLKADTTKDCIVKWDYKILYMIYKAENVPANSREHAWERGQGFLEDIRRKAIAKLQEAERHARTQSR